MTEDDNDEPKFPAVPYSVLHLAPSLPVQFSLRLPFSRNRVLVGQDSFGRLRGRVQRRPEDTQARITLAARLLSEQPLRPAHASEAAEHLRIALEQMPSGAEGEQQDQQKAMVCTFLGDSLIVLGEQAQARTYWAQAITLDPPPGAFSSAAQEKLDQYAA